MSQTITAPYSHTPLILNNRRLIVVSNREPYHLVREANTLRLEKTTGGLVSALDPVLQSTQGLWICWDSSNNNCRFDELCRLAELNNIEIPYEIAPIKLTEVDVAGYYDGFSNRQIWPLFHYFTSRYAFDEGDWDSYYQVNRKFARAVIEKASPEDLIWIQDYHLMLVPQLVREASPDFNIGFFCHIPFPHYEVFRMLPTRKEVLHGILGSDLIGFHTPSYTRYFMECAEKLLPGQVSIVDSNTLVYKNRRIIIQDFPISVDFDHINGLASLPETEEAVQQLKQSFPHGEIIGLGVDRLDYTKGILERLECISMFFERYPEYRKRLVFIQIAVPSRIKVQEYQKMKQEIDEAVGRINGRYSEDGWTPIHYLYRSFPLEELVAYYRAADFALVNPLRDGMNLVAKEYCAAHPDYHGVLILSEMTGAAHQLKASFLVNPYDHPAVAEAIYRAINASSEEKSIRMEVLRQNIQENNITRWLKNYLLTFNDAIKLRRYAFQ